MNLDMAKMLAKADPILETIILQVPKPLVQSTKDVFHDVMSCIVEQQIHYRSTKRIFAKALERANIKQLTLENFHLLEKYGLPQINLAISKYETIEAFVEYWTSNTLDFNVLSDDEVATQLSAIKGIGKWTIDMILLITLQRPNIFPYDDFHLKAIMVKHYGLNPKVKLKAQMLEIARKWKPQMSLAVLYLLETKNVSTKL
jgi:DNA-3-methyladenine glycosylase II